MRPGAVAVERAAAVSKAAVGVCRPVRLGSAADDQTAVGRVVAGGDGRVCVVGVVAAVLVFVVDTHPACVGVGALATAVGLLFAVSGRLVAGRRWRVTARHMAFGA